jgi:uncharacterized RDD family membrane protein YckC
MTMNDGYFDHERAEADMRAAIAAGDGVRYAAIHAQVAAARGETPVPAVRQESWPMAADVPESAFASYPLCSAGQRFGAWLIDWAAYYVLWIVCVGITAVVPIIGLFFLLGLIGAAVANQYVMGSTGQSLGKKAVGIYLVNEGTRKPIGGWAGIGRWLLHLLDTFSLGIGWFVGLGTGKTFADRIVGSVVVARPKAK